MVDLIGLHLSLRDTGVQTSFSSAYGQYYLQGSTKAGKFEVFQDTEVTIWRCEPGRDPDADVDRLIADHRKAK